ncbi:MAG TPA: hypothetical protein VLZ83_07830 [Edaphocola sp.]|nr:hypothetical protein [Edaphocola sp.]
MKRLFAIVVLIPFLLISCNKIQGKKSNEKAGALFQKNSWRVSEFYNEENDFSYLLSGYAFTFNTDGTVRAFKNGTEFMGNWKDTISIDSLNTEKESIKLNFPNIRPINDLNKNWEVAEKMTKFIHLKNLEREEAGYNHIFFKLNE